ncbi:FRIGIDA-like protein 1 [Euphorbia lathyris]|uniref:FRIGIDA-like protein 1 n=1 Tax=Euphorbia lathyris TaxID=212925 RepID=UPI0033133BEA
MASSNGTLKTIESALKLVDTKKESLKRAYDDLQAHSSLLSSFPLSWSDIDAHFSSLQTSLTRRFQDLQQSLESSEPLDSAVVLHGSGGSDQLATVNGGDPSSSSIQLHESQTLSKEVPVHEPSSSLNALIGNSAARPELVLLCEKRDGQGLRNYFNDHSRERSSIREELVSLMRAVPDAGAMVLDAMEGFFPANSSSRGDKDTDLCHLRKGCLDLFEVLIETKPVLSDQVKERAKTMALEWKNKVNLDGDCSLEALGFLNLIVAYELWGIFQADDLLNYFFVIARFKQATELCRAIGLGDLINDLVQKLIENEKHLLALKFVFEFGLTEKFQPVPLLKDHINECKRFSKKICEEGNNSAKAKNDARSREINALKAVLKVIDEHKLDSEYPRKELESQLETLQKQKVDKKVVAPSPNNRSQQLSKKQSQQQQSKKQRLNGNKRPVSIPGSISGASSAVHSFQQSHLPPAGLLSTTGPYGLIGSAPISSYSGASAGPYSISGVAMGYTGNPGPAGAHPYSAGNPVPAGAHSYSAGNPGPSGTHPYSDPYVPTGYYDRSAAYGGYNLPPQYHPGYYPQ